MESTGTVRPRINKTIYELVKRAALASCVADSHWLADAIKEKAAQQGFEIIEGEVIYSGTVLVTMQNHSSPRTNPASAGNI